MSDAEIRRISAILESVASDYAPDSVEALAIRDAALAFTVVQQHKALQQAFQKLRLAFDGVLTDEMKADLLRMGIDPDELDDKS